MPKQLTTRHQLAALLILASCGLGIIAGGGADKKDAPKPLPPEIVKAWKKAGATVGWSTISKKGAIYFLDYDEAEPGVIPAFHFRKWKKGSLAKLPNPGAPFGLDFEQADMQDSDLQELAGFTNLCTLNLACTFTLTNAGLKELTTLTNLQALDLTASKMTGAGVKELSKLTKLQSLRLFLSYVTDAGLKEIGNLKNLQSLDLCQTDVTDAGLKELAELKKLRSLVLMRTDVTDAGLKELTELKSLHFLDLTSTKVTNVGLKELAKLKSLQTLRLSGTKVTAEGVAALQKELPACKIVR